MWKLWAGFAFWSSGTHFPCCLYFSLALLSSSSCRSAAHPAAGDSASDSPLSHGAASKGASSPRGWFNDLLLHLGLLFSMKWKGMGRLSGPFHLCEVVYNSAVRVVFLPLLGLDVNDAVKVEPHRIGSREPCLVPKVPR